MSVRSYLEAAARLREALDLLGPYRGPCGLCGHPDARHQQADSITGGFRAGDASETLASEYLPDYTRDAPRVAAEITAFVLAADNRLHGLTNGRAAGLDREVWADLTTDQERTTDDRDR